MIFNKGDIVFVYDRRGDVTGEQTVAKVDQRKVVLSDGNTFTVGGIEWGRANLYPRGHIEPATDQLRATLAARKAEEVAAKRLRDLRRVCGQYLIRLPLDELEALYARLRDLGMPAID